MKFLSPSIKAFFSSTKIQEVKKNLGPHIQKIFPSLFIVIVFFLGVISFIFFSYFKGIEKLDRTKKKLDILGCKIETLSIKKLAPEQLLNLSENETEFLRNFLIESLENTIKDLEETTLEKMGWIPHKNIEIKELVQERGKHLIGKATRLSQKESYALLKNLENLPQMTPVVGLFEINHIFLQKKILAKDYECYDCDFSFSKSH